MSTSNNPLAPSAAFVSSVAQKNAAPQVYDTAAIQKIDSAHYLHPFTDFQDLASKGARVMVRGDGVYLWDSQGKKIVDGMSGLWCVNVGYGRTSISQAVYKQMETLPFYNSFFGTTNVPAAQLAAKLAQISPPQFQHVFFTSSGSEGNDTNLRMVRRYWDILGYKERHTIISRHNAYHGSTVAGASLGGMDGMHAQGGLPIPGIAHIGQPNYLESGHGLSPEAFGLKAAGWLEDKILEIGADKVAAFIGEPVQGAGGVIIPPSTYWPEVQRICDKYGILLIADEVICGFGRLGRWFGSELFGIKPDLITFAKGVTSGYVPLGGVLVGDRVAKVLIERGGEFTHGFTYSGHPVACAAALENIRIIEEEQLVAKVADDTGPYLKQCFASLGEHPLVGYADSCGLVAGLNLVRKKGTTVHDNELFDEDQGVGMICRGHMFDNGVIMRAVGERMIVAPPLVMTRAQIDEMVALIRLCLDKTYADVKAKGWV
ncbi:beta-alanine--pyruvate aminotransferase [Janthinobacterium sp. HH103]|uniref:aspartate aminotransferase family protein n=1 Tax=unclassified Janthinobacterium TaxID=2610881 RepID=UPI0008751232|nr:MULTISPECIES: aspartate aminotransferase family protein [unclassified Janthinobacterium]OEZ53585.1 beta-alanine--pyruvate aminotransferase [Janthinobacterium sp. HH100]OEZ78650.1 beta-alanine--pyruvate aminotransferase [Janthinobacterium sp. HH103]QOU75943.1 Putrescine--pyruvate aminotransferase [Janthinobacterium sp. HH102]